MQRFYSPSAGGFFSEDVHGARSIESGDPPETHENPDCLIPIDAVAVSDDLWRSLLAATAEGQKIMMIAGAPVAVLPSPENEGGEG